MKKKEEHLIEDSPFSIIPFRTKLNLKEIEESDKSIILARKRYYKADEYTKVITNVEIDLSDYYKISNLGKTLLWYILTNCLDYNTPTFRLIVEEFCLLLKYKDKSKVWVAINELINHNYIARTKTKEVYWINHNLFYKGNYFTDKQIKFKNNEAKKHYKNKTKIGKGNKNI